MRLNFHGQLVDEKQVRAGFIGCGSHSFRNVYPVFQFTPIDLVATCDLDKPKAEAFARQFGAKRAYTDHREMISSDEIDAVFIVTNYDEKGRPRYPQLAIDCLKAGKHVWIEKPPAASVGDIDAIAAAAKAAGKNVVCGLKKMFSPANEKAKALIGEADFGKVTLATLQYPTTVPTVEDFQRYKAGEKLNHVVGFLDHLCHPTSNLVNLLGMPQTLMYQRTAGGSGLATFTFAGGAIANLALPQASSGVGGFEFTQIFSDKGRRIVVENNLKVFYFRDAPGGLPYGANPHFYHAPVASAAAYWEPEFSLGQLYNKGLFIHGYYNEVNEFARSILDGRPPAKGTLDHARQVTRIFEGFAEGPGKVISL
jgi:predicted dehydrogenase